jgi:hypothetical protein
MTILEERPITVTAAAPLVRVKSRGYYKDSVTGDRYTSVTTIINRTVAKPALVPWSANTVAKCAMDNLPYLARSSRTDADRIDAYDWLRGAADRKKEERGDIGTAVHALIENRILGTPVPPEVSQNEELLPYVEHFEAFVREWRVTFTASEMIVGNLTHRYAGTLDFLMSSPLIAKKLDTDPAIEISGDLKTGGELDTKRGVYPEASLQMAAYSHAEFAQLRDGSRVPMPPVAAMGVVLHLRPEGYRLVPLNVGRDVFTAFLRLRQLDETWVTGLSKHVISPALTLEDETDVA